MAPTHAFLFKKKRLLVAWTPADTALNGRLAPSQGLGDCSYGVAVVEQKLLLLGALLLDTVAKELSRGGRQILSTLLPGFPRLTNWV